MEVMRGGCYLGSVRWLSFMERGCPLSERALASILRAITDAMKAGDKVTLRDFFGSERVAREGTQPPIRRNHEHTSQEGHQFQGWKQAN